MLDAGCWMLDGVCMHFLYTYVYVYMGKYFECTRSARNVNAARQWRLDSHNEFMEKYVETSRVRARARARVRTRECIVYVVGVRGAKCISVPKHLNSLLSV